MIINTKYYNKLNDKLVKKYSKRFNLNPIHLYVKVKSKKDLLKIYKDSIIFWNNERPETQKLKKVLKYKTQPKLKPYTSTREVICKHYIEQLNKKIEKLKR